MSKTLQRDIEAQKSRRTRKPEAKASRTSTVSSTPERADKAHIPDTQDRGPRLKPEMPEKKPIQKPTGTDKVRQAILETDIPKQKPTETAEAPMDESKTKPVTKICIRWLPAGLPEHVFWSSVEPALPWFDPQNVGSVKQKDREVLCAMIRDSDKGNELDSAEEPAADEAPDVTELRRLPLAETKTVSVSVYESENLARLDCQPYWRQYFPGKQHKSRAKPDEPSRAYILFAEPAEADHFYQHFQGHAFGKNGVINKAVVELAPFQHVPWSLPDPANNPLEGTIDDDPHFAAFLKAIANGKPQDDEQTGGTALLSAASAETQQPRISYAAAASLGNDGAQGASKAVMATPLIKHLRKIKTGSSKPLALDTKTAKPASPAKPPPSGAKSGRKKAAPAKEPAPLTTTQQKRSRRRKRE
ncbi:hypothetical protein GGI23_001711 [Coemansia sp. RSA 2559]|nr:hypothetical protein GGI23_001711 [Coemansia sp. RSA 2559]